MTCIHAVCMLPTTLIVMVEYYHTCVCYILSQGSHLGRKTQEMYNQKLSEETTCSHNIIITES